MKDEIADAAKLLSDAHPDVIVFHCTDTSMTQGPQGEGNILDIVKDATGIDAMATSRLVLEALQTLGMKKVVLLTPYKSNKAVIDYLTAAGVTVLRDVAMKLEAKDFGSVTPAEWARLAKENDRPDSDGVFLSCTNTTQIEAIADIEKMLGKPVVNSNQAVLWGCVKRLQDKVAACADAAAWAVDAELELKLEAEHRPHPASSRAASPSDASRTMGPPRPSRRRASCGSSG